jgi:hypothetical protein
MTREQKAKAYDELKVKAQQIHLGFLGLKDICRILVTLVMSKANLQKNIINY